MNIAFEISPLMTASGTFGDKSGVYRYTYGLISSLSKYLKKKDRKSKIYLFTFNYDLLKYPLNPELYSLIKNKNVTYLGNLPKVDRTKFPYYDILYHDIFDFLFLRTLLGAVNKIFGLKSIYRSIEERVRHNNFLKFLDEEFKKKDVKYIVHSETSFSYLKGYRHITTVYDLTSFIIPEFHRTETIDLQTRKLRFASKYCEGIICISQSTKNDLINYAPEFKNKKIIIGYPGLEEIFKKGNKSSLVKTVKAVNLVTNKKVVLRSKKYILYYGTFEPRKNLVYLVKAFLDLVEENRVPENFRLLMIGGKGWGDVRSKIVDYLIENYSTEDKAPIIISNYVDDKQLIKIIKNAYGLVYPSLYEGFGLPVLESMTLRTPVICSSNSSLTEVGGDAVLYTIPKDFIDIKNKLDYLIKNKQIANIMAKDGLIQSLKFSWEETAEKFYKMVKSI